MADFVDTYVGPVADGRVEYAEQKLRLDRIEERLRRLSDRPGADEAEVGWETARLAAGEALEEMGESAGESLVEGVVVGTPDLHRERGWTVPDDV
ncbi:MAG: hypothetical protein ABEL76_12005, partial [Bradymonadaceae bacterium]